MSIEYANYVISSSRSPLKKSRRGTYKTQGKKGYIVPDGVDCGKDIN